jgi:hypothetical protein
VREAKGQAISALRHIILTPTVIGEKLRSKFKMTILTMVSYSEVAFTFDADFLCGITDECRVREGWDTYRIGCLDRFMKRPCQGSGVLWVTSEMELTDMGLATATKLDCKASNRQVERTCGQRVWLLWQWYAWVDRLNSCFCGISQFFL